MVVSLEGFGGDPGAEIGDAGRVAGVGHGEGEGVFHPVVPDAIGIVRGGGEGVLLRAEQAGELEGEAEGLAGGDGAEREVLEFGIGAVDLEADAGADHDADDGLVDRFVKPDGDADGGGFAGLEDDGGLAGGAEGFEGDDFGSAIAAAEGRGEARRDGLAGGAEAGGEMLLVAGKDFAVVAPGMEAALVEPPDLVGEVGDEVGFVRGEQNGRAAAPEAFEVCGGVSADEGVAGGERLVEGQGGGGGEVERIGGAEVAGAGRGVDRAGGGPGQAGGEPEEFALAA